MRDNSQIIRTFAAKKTTKDEDMIVCIAEKPSVARDIARIIGANSSRDGYMEGNGYQVTWTFGHLCTLKAWRLYGGLETVGPHPTADGAPALRH